MEYFGTSGRINHFPRQMLSDAQKTESWYKENVEAGVSLIDFESDTGVRARRIRKSYNYDLVSDQIQASEVERVVNPFGIQYGEIMPNYRNCPILNTNLNVLIGEERKRFFNPIVTVVNSDAVSQKQEYIKQAYDQFLIGQVTNPEMNEEQIKQELLKLDKWAKFTYRDRRERMASQTIEYLYRSLNLKEEFSFNFEDLLIASEEILVADILAGEPILRRANPLNIFTLRAGESHKIEDSDIIVEDVYMPLGTIIDNYYDELKPSQIKELEEGYTQHLKATGIFKNQLTHKDYFTVDDYIDSVGIGDVIMKANTSDKHAFGRTFDEEGNVRTTRVLWKGRRKVGFLEFFDDNGELQTVQVDERFKPNKELGQTVEWRWISEWYEGTRLGNDIYIKMKPREVQMRRMDNPSACHPGIVGTINNFGNRRGLSMVDLAYDYQLLFNAIMSRLEQAIAKDKGKIGIVPVSLIPDGWTMDQWMYYAEIMGWGFFDPFNEGSKGAATGKLAGAMNVQQSSMDLEQGRFIQQQLLILDFLHNRIDDVTGISPQRKGAIDNRETVGGVERAVIQSSHITEKWFGIHDNTKVRGLEVLLETAKIAWKDKKFKRSFILDDGSQAILDFDYDTYVEAEYGIDITTASSDQEMMQTLRSLAQPFMQNGGTLSMVMELFRTKDPASLQRKFETFEEQLQQQQAEQAQQIEESKQAQLQMTLQDKQADRDLKKYEIDTRAATDIEKALINKEEVYNADSDDDSINDYIQLRKLELDSKKHEDTQKLKENQLAETKRSNLKNEELKLKQINKTKANDN